MNLEATHVRLGAELVSALFGVLQSLPPAALQALVVPVAGQLGQLRQQV